MGIHSNGFHPSRIFFKFVDGCFSDKVTSFHYLVFLGDGEFLSAPCAFKLESIRMVVRGGRSELVRIKTGALSDRSTQLLSVSYGETGASIGMTRSNHDRGFDRPASKRGFHHIGDENPFDDIVFQAKGACGFWRKENCIIPREFGHGIRPFLHPTIIGVSAVIHCGGLNKYCFKGGGIFCGRAFNTREKPCDSV